MTTGDVHVGDVGTHYKGQIQDAGAAFDPTSAATKTLIFKTPAATLERDATVTQEGEGWFLTYTLVVPLDVDFHASPGLYKWQGRVVFADGQRYSTDIETYEVKGNL